MLTYRLCAFSQGFLRPCQQVSSVHQVFVEPLTSDDWEILVGENHKTLKDLCLGSSVVIMVVSFHLKMPK